MLRVVFHRNLWGKEVPDCLGTLALRAIGGERSAGIDNCKFFRTYLHAWSILLAQSLDNNMVLPSPALRNVL